MKFMLRKMPAVYIAGPDVFNPAHDEVFSRVRALCKLHGLRAVIPLDNELEGEGPPKSADIYQGNIDMLNRVDGVLANLQGFRGPEPDSGTCFEVGYAVAKGLPVISYGDLSSYRAKVGQYSSLTVHAETGRTIATKDGWFVEDFGNPYNLMLAHGSVKCCGSLESAVASMSELLYASTRPALRTFPGFSTLVGRLASGLSA